MAHAYARSADSAWKQLASTSDADFAGPAIMCQSFAIELLLKFFLASDHPTAKTSDDLVAAGIKLRRHKYSELFDQLADSTKQAIADSYSAMAGSKVVVDDFRLMLVEQGDEPFVYWRYVYEKGGVSRFDLRAFKLLTDSLGKAAEVKRRAAAAGQQAAISKPPSNDR